MAPVYKLYCQIVRVDPILDRCRVRWSDSDGFIVESDYSLAQLAPESNPTTESLQAGLWSLKPDLKTTSLLQCLSEMEISYNADGYSNA